MGAEKKGRTVGSDAAKSAGEKVLCADNDTTIEECKFDAVYQARRASRG